MRKAILFLLLFCVAAIPASAQTLWSIGYDTPFKAGYVDTSTFNWLAVTHISFVGGQPNSDGTVSLSTNFASIVPGVITAAHTHGVRVLYCLTAVTGATQFTGAITDHEAAFVSNIMSTVNTYGFDGVDVDNEETWNGSLMATFLGDMRSNLGSKSLTATSLVNYYANWTSQLAGYVDRVNVLTYDMDGTFDPYTWFNTALFDPTPLAVYSVNLAVTRYIANSSVPARKLGIGIAFYGQLWTPNTGPKQAYGGGAIETEVTYTDVVANYNTGSATRDATAQVPWIAVSGSSWLNYDDPTSIATKLQYVKTNSLGGWVIWTLGSDAVNITNPLLTTVQQALPLATSTIPSKVTISGMTVH